MKNNKNKKSSPWKSIRVGLVSLLVMVIFAYGFQITKVNLEELRSERRQESLIRVTRALAKPDIFAYDQVEEIVNFPIHVPCPADGNIADAPEQNTTEPYLTISPTCASPGEVIQVEGFNFAPYTNGPLRFIPGSDSGNVVSLGREIAETDANGHFIVIMQLPDRQSNDAQFIRATLRRNVGTPHFTQTARDTWEKIIETVFLALLATVFGTLLAIPLSFIAARNLMKPVKSPLTSVSLSVLGWPIGIVIGFIAVRLVGDLSILIGSNIWINLASIIVSPVLIWLGLRWALPQEEITIPSLPIRLARLAVLLLMVLISFYGLFQLASLAMSAGKTLESTLGSFSFLGYFLFQVGDIVAIITPALGALAAGGALGSFLGRLGQHASEKLSVIVIKTLNLVLTTMAGATVLGLLGQLVEWLYQIGAPLYTLWSPIAVGAALGLMLAIFTKAKEPLPIGMVIYSITRTFLNALRSVEALVMAIVFVIAVGIGPFAGVMALGLHTIVSLAKLYSEQVESILTGPLEAVEATGANRLQTIVYAVIPQIVPPYISYTMYRWDINVRMSTIIGFVGGGGIGFLLQQNINLLNYRAASAQMLAIAVVVASMDYISSVLREKTI
ncbi:MAG: ABC transporter permease subunit [Anaerolineales bacterium]|nr:ABC transporter permease subunit [Anaerolineales bacterium]